MLTDTMFSHNSKWTSSLMADVLSMWWILLIPATESMFACEVNVTRPGNGLPYYWDTAMNGSYKVADDTCRLLKANLPAFRDNDKLILTDPPRIWSSAKRRYWTHVSLDHGLSYESWAVGEPSQTNAGCLSLSETLMYAKSCSDAEHVICMTYDLSSCNGRRHFYDDRCYFVPEAEEISLNFPQAVSSCRDSSAVLIEIHNEKQVEWLSETFTSSFWSGYAYNVSSTDYYWYDGSRVSTALWKDEDNRTKDCVVFTQNGELESTDCEEENAFLCTLEVPYANRPQVACTEIGDECLCYWRADQNGTFDEALTYCLSDGGTLFYPNNPDKVAAVAEFNQTERFWIGISDGHTHGVLRGSDASAITWAPWADHEPSPQTNRSCVYIKDKEFYSSLCSISLNFFCQNRLDVHLYPCNKTTGCLRSEDFWDVKDSDSNYVSNASGVVRNVATFEECWDMCVNYIGFLCLIATYEVGTEACRLVDTETGIWQRERGLLTRQRQRRVVDPSSYCVQDRTGTALNYQQAIAKCAELGPGWSIPVIRDATMNAKLSDYYGWISAKSTIAGVYKTHEGEYIPYSRWLSNEPDSFWGGCSSLSLDGWKSVYCNMPMYRTKCLAYLDDICRHHPNITHGHVVQNSTTRSVLYICDDGYFMPTLKATSFYVNCDCDWLTSLERLENCTDIECPPPADFGNRTLMTFSGLRINDTALYQCPNGYQVSETGLVYYNVTCRLERSTVNGTWSDHPDIEALNCNASKPMLVNAFAIINDVSIGSMMHIVCEEGYRIYNSTTNTINTTCEVDELGLTANWCWVPKCEAIRCPQPASVHMASYVVLGNKTNDNTTYTCLSNYRIKDSSRHEANATCGYDENYQGIWLGVPTCELITCSAPPMLKNAFLDVTPNTTEIGAIATYQCNESFTLFRNQSQVNHTNKFNATCLANYALHGIWSFDYTCETPLCYEPPVVENSSLEMSTTTLNSSVNYTCSVGYIFPSTGKRTATSQCVLELGQLLPHWTPVGNCTPITCGEAPNISHASVVSLSSRDIGSAAEYSCDLGFAVRKAGSFESNFQLTCSLNESLISAYWSDPPTCEAMICSAPPTIANGKVEVQGHGIGDRAIYTCDDHYKISSSASSFGVSRFQESVCVLDAYGGVIWQPIPTCIEESTKQTVAPLIRQCSAPPNIRGTTLHYKHTFINSVSVYVTRPGFAFECQGRTRSLICQTNGRWGIGVASSKQQLCQRIHVPGATLSTEETAVGTEVTVTCINRNARMENGLSTMKIKCTVGGKWTYVPRNCQVNRCGPFDIVEHSGIVAFNNSVGGLVVVKCDKSSSFPQGLRDNSFRCLPDLTWERHGFCIVNACRALTVPRYGTLSTYIAVQGTVVDVKCLPGYMFPDRSRVKHVTCNSTLNWNATIPDCELLTCPNPPNVTNASTTKIETQYNSNITYTCEIPYRMETGHTELTIRCTESGQWTPTSVSCDFGRCPPVPEVENAEPDRRLATNGSVVVYTCLDGYAMANGERQMTISCDGTSWNFTETTSIKSKCPELNLTHVSWIQGGNGYGEETRFVCDDGYQYDGSTGGVLRCQANSHWSEDITGCLPVDCGSPPEMKNSVRSIVPENVLGTIVNYECLPNYRIQPGVTNVSVTCTKSGEWTNLTSQCTIIKCPAVPVWMDGMSTNSTNNHIGTVLNISCWTDEGNSKTILLTRCTSDGEWLPSLDRCGTKEKVVRFEPEPEEARASQGIGVVILACIMIFFLLITISDVPAIVNGLKGNKKMIRVRKRRHQRD